MRKFCDRAEAYRVVLNNCLQQQCPKTPPAPAIEPKDLAIYVSRRVAELDFCGVAPKPLLLAVDSNRQACVEFLLAQGAKAKHDQRYTGGLNVLQLAVKVNNMEIIEMLLESGINLLQFEEDETTSACLYAAEHGRDEAVRLIVNASLKAGVTADSIGFQMALTVACAKGYSRVADHLIRVGVNINQTLYKELSPIMACCKYMQSDDTFFELVQIPGLNVNLQGRDKKTALYFACKYVSLHFHTPHI